LTKTLVHIAAGFAAAVISGTLLCAAFPSYSYAILVWIALVPLLLATLDSKPAAAFTWWLACGFLYYIESFSWVHEVADFRMAHYLPLLVFYSLYFGLFGLCLGFISNRLGWRAAACAVPFLWVSVEFLRSNMTFLSLPWGLLAHSQYLCPTVIQLADLTGAYGLSFVIALFNAALAAALLTVIKNRFGGKLISPAIRQPFVLIGSAMACTAFTLIYGFFFMPDTPEGRQIRLAVVQGNIEQARKWDPAYAEYILDTYDELTRRASSSNPELIVWPETATPRSISIDKKLYGRIKQLAVSSGAHLLLGSSQLQKFNLKDKDSARYLNSAFLISPDARQQDTQRYDKIHLFPFGEQLPYPDTIPWSMLAVPKAGNYIAGKEYKVFDLNGYRFAVTICWENIFPNMARRFVEGGAEFIVNITNEAWFGRTSAPYQFLAMSVFRAVENRIYIVRCANTGISCCIGPNGRIAERVVDERGVDTFVRGVESATVIPLQNRTFYHRFGDWPAWSSALIALSFVAAALIARQRPTRSLR